MEVLVPVFDNVFALIVALKVLFTTRAIEVCGASAAAGDDVLAVVFGIMIERD